MYFSAYSTILGVGGAISVLFLALALLAFYLGQGSLGISEVSARLAVSDEIICGEMRTLSYKLKNTVSRGEGIKLTFLRHILVSSFRRIYKKARKKSDLYEYEKWIYENYYVLSQTLKEIKGAKFHNLPHIGARPRIYYIAKNMVELSEARLDNALITKYLKCFLVECELDFEELTAFNDMLKLILLEYTATFCRMDLNEAAKIEGGAFSLNRRLVRYNSLVGSAITALRNRALLFELKDAVSLCAADEIFNEERCGLYGKMAIATRAAYLFKCAKTAKKSRETQKQLAERLIIMADPFNMHVGELLFHRKSTKNLQRLFIALLVLASASICVLLSFWIKPIILRPIFFVFAFLPIFSIVKRASNGVFAVFYRECAPFMMDFSRHIPKEHAAVVVVPVLVKGAKDFKLALDNILVLKAANQQKNINFALLVDFPSRESEKLNDDEREVVALAKKVLCEGIFVFIRARKKDESGFYMAYERKRGALLDLNRFLLKGESEVFLLCPKELEARYVITLDADTFINCARELIETAAHPLNARYSVIAPKIKSVISDDESAFSLLFKGCEGFDSYSSADGELMSRAFDCGNYMGKGIYNVERFMERVDQKLPDGAILSHDFIEGALSGAVNCTYSGLDSFTDSFREFFLRQLRWTRGDWQLLPYLSKKLKDRKGNSYISPLSPMQRFFILNNLIFSLLPVCSLALIILSFFTGAFLPLGIAFLHLIVQVLGDFVVGLAAFGYRQKVGVILIDRAKNLARAAFIIATLPLFALYNIVAIVKTIYRLYFSKKNLLQWRTSLEVRLDGGDTLSAYIKMFLPEFAFASLMLLLCFFSSAPFLHLSILVAFLLAPFAAYLISQKREKPRGLEAHEKQYLKEHARKIWSYFEDCMTKEHNYLPCDNFGAKGFAHRTSPTNIGFGLLSTVLAFKLGIIDRERVANILDSSLEAINGLEKLNGNLYNWYDTRTLRVLNSRFVSSVDSGNFLSCLLMCCALLSDDDFFAIKDKMNTLAQNTRLEKLLDSKRKLLYVGYNESALAFSDSHYDILASESALTYLSGYAVGKIGKDSLQSCGRDRVSYKGLDLLYSWTGGAFEYLMCSQFYCFPKKTLYGQSLVNAAKAQLKYANKCGLNALGVSESQYDFELDGEYQYRAHGIKGIAAKSNAEDERVFAPYAAYLTLTKNKRALSYIKAMEELDGKYGLSEAVDYSKDKKIIKTFMAHHLGMSMLAIANMIMSEPPNEVLSKQAGAKAAILALNERTPTTKSSKKLRLDPIKPEKKSARSFFGDLGEAHLMTNGKYHSIIDAKGGGFSSYQGVPLNCFEPFGYKGGVELYLDGRDILSEARARFCGGSASFFTFIEGLEIRVDAFVLPDLEGEMRVINIKNMSGQARRFSVGARVVPQLAPLNEMTAHPSFSRLFITAGFDEYNKLATAFRSNKDNPIFLGLCVEGEISSFCLARGGSRGECQNGQTIDAALSINKEVFLEKGRSSVVSFALFASRDARQLALTSQRVRAVGFSEGALKAAESFFRLNNEFSEQKLALINRAIRAINYREVKSERLAGARESDVAIVRSLGINLNNPIMLIDFSRLSFEDLKEQLRAASAVLKASNPFSLVVLYRENQGYYTPQRDLILSAVLDAGLDGQLKDGAAAFVLNQNEIGIEATRAIRTLSDVDFN